MEERRNSTPVLLHLIIAVATSAASDPSPRRWGRKRRFRSLCSKGMVQNPPQEEGRERFQGGSACAFPPSWPIRRVRECWSILAQGHDRRPLGIDAHSRTWAQVTPLTNEAPGGRSWVFYPMDLRSRIPGPDWQRNDVNIARRMYPSAGDGAERAAPCGLYD